VAPLVDNGGAPAAGSWSGPEWCVQAYGGDTAAVSGTFNYTVPANACGIFFRSDDSTLDGGFGKEQSPLDLDTIADLQKVPELLRKRGYKESDATAILYGNWVRFFREAWRRG